MDEHKIYLKSGAILTVDAVKIDFPGKSKILKIHVLDKKIEPSMKILTSEVIAIIRTVNVFQGVEPSAFSGSARRKSVL